jgi:hypothetical protein
MKVSFFNRVEFFQLGHQDTITLKIKKNSNILHWKLQNINEFNKGGRTTWKLELVLYAYLGNFGYQYV